jgi:major membrane immunogen (membrane-anchored lipoprotein)
MTLEDPIKLDKDIDAVSGATISSRTFTLGARKCLWLARRFFNAGSITDKEKDHE